MEFGSFPFGTEGGAEGTKVAVGMLLSSGAFLFLEAKKSVSFASGAGPDDRVIFLFYAPPLDIRFSERRFERSS